MEAAALLMTSTLFGGMLLYSFGFAPFVFAKVDGEQAGKLIRAAFPYYYLFVIGVALIASLALSLSDQVSAILLGVVFVLGLIARQILMPAINNARDAQMAGDSAAKKLFGRLHGLSVLINFVQLGAIGWALVRFLQV